jgi:hypothetical protein
MTHWRATSRGGNTVNKKTLNEILIGITIISVIIIAVVGLFDVDLAVKIGVDAITVAIIIGLLLYVTDVFKRK